jgi:hypothetical protein
MWPQGAIREELFQKPPRSAAGAVSFAWRRGLLCLLEEAFTHSRIGEGLVDLDIEASGDVWRCPRGDEHADAMGRWQSSKATFFDKISMRSIWGGVGTHMLFLVKFPCASSPQAVAPQIVAEAISINSISAFETAIN